MIKLDAVRQKMNFVIIFGCQGKVASGTHLSLLLNVRKKTRSRQEMHDPDRKSKRVVRAF